MNLLDLAIVALVAGLMVIGFFGGIGRIVASLLAVYLATIISAIYYDEVARSLVKRSERMRQDSAELLSFMLLFMFLAVIFFFVIGQSIKSVQVRRHRLAIFDNVGGAVLAVIGGALTLAVTLSIVVIILGAFNRSVQRTDDGTVLEQSSRLERYIDDSELVPLFLHLQEPISVTFKPWFPEGLPPILEPAPSP